MTLDLTNLPEQAGIISNTSRVLTTLVAEYEKQGYTTQQILAELLKNPDYLQALEADIMHERHLGQGHGSQGSTGDPTIKHEYTE